jgi:UPF0755 protein
MSAHLYFMQNARRLILTFISVCVVIFIIVSGISYYITQALNKPLEFETQTNVLIPRGSNFSDISELLEKAGVIDSPFFFRMRYGMENEPKLKAGEYSFSPHMTMRDIIQHMARGDVVLHKITMPEGMNSAFVVRLIREEALLTGDITNIPPDGTLLPNTYSFTRGDDRMGIITRMQEAMKKALQEAWDWRSPSKVIHTPDDILILASIVEKEEAPEG